MELQLFLLSFLLHMLAGNEVFRAENVPNGVRPLGWKSWVRFYYLLLLKREREVRACPFTFLNRKACNSGDCCCLILKKSSCIFIYDCLPALIKLYTKTRTVGLLLICLIFFSCIDKSIKAKRIFVQIHMPRMVQNYGKLGCFNQ